MLALGIRYLTGYAVATDVSSRERAEWPPHPGRVFMALAAAHFEAGEDPLERQALEWLQEQGAPAIRASDASYRSVVSLFVPVNDRAGPSPAPIQAAPGLTRRRAERTLPCARPDEDTVWLLWTGADPSPEQRTALAGLAARVARIGHSSSLVQLWLADGAVPAPTWEVEEVLAERRLRVATSGTLAHLEQQYNKRAIERYAALTEEAAQATGNRKAQLRVALREEFDGAGPRSLRPVLSLSAGYRRTDGEEPAPVCGTVFDPRLVVLRFTPSESSFSRLDIVSTLQVTGRMREAVIAAASPEDAAPIPHVIHGHQSDGTASEQPHCAFIPLPFVGTRHSDGHLLGVGIALPKPEHWTDYRSDRRLLFGAVAAVTELVLGPLGRWSLRPEERDTPPWNLTPEAWTGGRSGCRAWGTVTPIVFDRHPKAKSRADYRREVAAMVHRACERVGLPAPIRVTLTAVAPHWGAPASRDFPRLRRKDGSERRHTHAMLLFEGPVQGPIVLGAGRYRGYGLCRPLTEWEHDG
jgi:CRISPR-associated protein Csb2